MGDRDVAVLRYLMMDDIKEQLESCSDTAALAASPLRVGDGRTWRSCFAGRIVEQRQYGELPVCQPQQQRPDES
jgi:hypothetical protein